MPNIGALLKQEISRLCRRELRRETAMLKRSSVGHRHNIAALKRQVVELTRKTAVLYKLHHRAAPTTEAAAPASKAARFQARGLRSLRQRLGFSQAQFGKLIGVSPLSIYNWEGERATPKRKYIAEIAKLRSMGKREAVARLEQQSSKPVREKRPKLRSRKIAQRNSTPRGKRK